MALAQFLMPGEDVRYRSAGVVRRGRTAHTLYLTGGRLLLHSEGGRLGPKESAIAENLADLDSLEYAEGGLLTGRGSLKINFRHDTVSLSGEPEVLKDVWRQLQPYAVGPAAFNVDEEATLVTPPEPLFDNQPYPPAQVEPIPTTTPPISRRATSVPRLPLILAAVCLLALAGAAAAIKFRHKLFAAAPSAPTTPQQQASAEGVPSAAPSPALMGIMDEAFTVEPGAHRAVKFTVPPEPADARLVGGFRVTAGSYVDFYLMNEAQYDRFAGGGPPRRDERRLPEGSVERADRRATAGRQLLPRLRQR